MTSTLIGLVVGQLLVGPLSDAVGRRWPLLLGAAFVFAQQFGFTPPQVGLLLAAGGLCMITATQLNPRLLARYEPQQILLISAAGPAQLGSHCSRQRPPRPVASSG